MRRLTAYRGHNHHFYFTNPGWYDGGRLPISSDREDRNVNLATGLVFKMTGCYDHFGVSRLYKLFIKDKRAMRHSVNKVLSSASAEWFRARSTRRNRRPSNPQGGLFLLASLIVSFDDPYKNAHRGGQPETKKRRPPKDAQYFDPRPQLVPLIHHIQRSHCQRPHRRPSYPAHRAKCYKNPPRTVAGL